MAVVKNVETEIAKYFKKIMELLNLDVNSAGCKETPQRYAKMMVNELCKRQFEGMPKMTMFKQDTNDMVIEKNIWFSSMCEHHFLPFFGFCHIGYIPNEGNIIGISKMHRLTKYLAAKPQTQERLNSELRKTLQKVLGTENVAVVMEAQHLCALVRGVEDVNSTTVTSSVGGVFETSVVKSEFISLLKLRK